MVQSSLATKSQSFDLVKGEIEQTIKQAEASLERFQENRESGEDLQNCVDYLNQLRGIFILVELRGGTLLCQEAVALANDVPVGANDDKNILLTTLNSALFILRRYVEYYYQERADHPELLLPVINELREARKESPYPDSRFFELNLQSVPDFCRAVDLPPLQSLSHDYDVYARRMRLMYQIGLLGVLRERDPVVSKKLMARAAVGFARLTSEHEMSRLWCLLSITLDTMLDYAMGFGKNRKRLMMAIEKLTRQMVYMGESAAAKPVPEHLVKELIYILYRSGSGNQEVTQLLQGVGIAPTDLPESIMETHRKRLYGPGADVLKSLSGALQEELNQLKDKLDIIERGIEPDLSEFGSIAASLERLSNTLLMLDLTRMANLAKRQADVLKRWEADNTLPDEKELYALADAVLSIEDAAMQIVSRGITQETDALATPEGGASNDSLYLKEALYVVADEARAALTLAKRAITAFIESDYDKLHLANLPSTLHSIWGGFMVLDDPEAANVLARIADSIQKRLLDSKDIPSQMVLEAMADALTSMEYYIETVGKRDGRNLDLLKLADTSLDDAGL